MLEIKKTEIEILSQLHKKRFALVFTLQEEHSVLTNP